MTSVLDSRADLKILNHTAVLIHKMESLTFKNGHILQKLKLFHVFKAHQLTVHPCFQVSGTRGGSGSSESWHHNVTFKEKMPQTCSIYFFFSFTFPPFLLPSSYSTELWGICLRGFITTASYPTSPTLHPHPQFGILLIPTLFHILVFLSSAGSEMIHFTYFSDVWL